MISNVTQLLVRKLRLLYSGYHSLDPSHKHVSGSLCRIDFPSTNEKNSRELNSFKRYQRLFVLDSYDTIIIQIFK